MDGATTIFNRFSMRLPVFLIAIFVIPAYSQNNGDIRLVDGGAAYKGRVEVYYDGTWGTICDDNWGWNEARVVCRQLNLPYRASAAVSDAFFGEGSGQIWLDNVDCVQTKDSRIDECEHRKWGKSNCKHDEDAGVICSETGLSDIRLSGSPAGMDNRGWVEVLYEGVWLAVCRYGDDRHHNKDNNWNNQAAHVACRQLGYPGGKAILSSNSEGISTRNTKLVVNDVRCGDGLHRSLHECFYEVQEADCHADRQAGVICFETGFSDIRLVGSPDGTDNRGLLEILYEEDWLAVCQYGDHENHQNDNNWNNEAANVACHQLGFLGGNATSYRPDSNGITASNTRSIVNDIRCGDGSYNTLQDCFYEVQEKDCREHRKAGVICFVPEDVTSSSMQPRITPTARYQDSLTISNEASNATRDTWPLKMSTPSNTVKDGNISQELRNISGTIAGSAVGVLVLVTVVSAIVWCILKSKNQEDSNNPKLEFVGPNYDMTICGPDGVSISNIKINNGSAQNKQEFSRESGYVNERSEEDTYADRKRSSSLSNTVDAKVYINAETSGNVNQFVASSTTSPMEGWVDNSIYASSDDNIHTTSLNINDEEVGWVDNSIYGD